jgi:hypothetical protein
MVNRNLATQIGAAIVALETAVLLIAFLRYRQRAFAWYGWASLSGLLAAESLCFGGVHCVAIYFTPIMWTCYILLVDAAVLAIRGHSFVHDQPRGLVALSLFSIPLWMVFEAYNLRLENWVYQGLPKAWPLALLGYGWSFATITPAIFETADLIHSFGWFRPGRRMEFKRGLRSLMAVFGAVCLVIPIVVPRSAARTLFILVWIGFVFLLDPINYRLGLPSLIGDLQQGWRSRFYALLASGFVCGWYWEFWNYWAAAKWLYIFPMFQQFKIFEMPVPGYLGFLPFALECFVMYVTAASMGMKLLSRRPRTAALVLPGRELNRLRSAGPLPG